MIHKDLLIIDDFLSYDECDELVELYHDTDVIIEQEDNVWTGRGRWPTYTDVQKIKLKEKRKLLTQDYFNKKLELSNLHMMVWEVGHEMTPHSDYGANNEFPGRDYASVIYLNEDYVGGDIYFPDLGVTHKPKKGQLVSFHGGNTFHGVKRISEGTRFTNICWFQNV